MLTLDQARGIAASAWCRKETENKVMDVELCEVFAQLLVEHEFSQMASKMYQTMAETFPHRPDVARAAARVALGILMESQLK